MNHWSNVFPALSSAGIPCTPLFDYRIITVSGPDASTLLQGQLTCDINILEQGQWVIGSHCNAQGRMISNFIAAKLNEDTIGLRVHISIADSALAALQKYAIFSKVTLTLSDLIALAFKESNISDQKPFKGEVIHQHYTQELGATRLCYVWGTQAESVEQETWQELWVAPDSDVLSHFHFAENDQSEDLSSWHTSKVNMGMADVQAATQEKHLPQAFNLDILEGISFKKGCYTGQEVIARVHYKGRSKQRVHLATIGLDSAGSNDIDVGQAIFDSNGKNIGMIIDKAYGSSPSCCQLLLCTSLFDSSNDLFLNNQGLQPLQRKPLPYNIDL